MQSDDCLWVYTNKIFPLDKLTLYTVLHTCTLYCTPVHFTAYLYTVLYTCTLYCTPVHLAADLIVVVSVEDGQGGGAGTGAGLGLPSVVTSVTGVNIAYKN